MDARSFLRSTKYLLGISALSTLFFHLPVALAAPVNLQTSRHELRTHLEMISFSPQTVHFKDVVAGQSYTRQVLLTNHGRSAVAILSVRRSNSIFRVRGLKVPVKVGPGESVGFEIGFIPPRAGYLGTDFTFTAGHAGRVVLHADGNRAHGGLVSNPQKLNFGAVHVGSGERIPITLANLGSVTRTVSRIWALGNGFGRTDLHLPMMLEPGESATLYATFAPRAIGAASGEIVVDAGGVNLAIPLGGKGSDSVYLGIAPAQLDFINVTAGGSATLSGKLQAGRSPVTIYSAGITSSEFALTGLSFPLTIAAGQSKSYQVTFSPGLSGNASAVLSFRGAPGVGAEEGLLGNAIPATQHKVNLSWNAGSSGVVGYNIYRANASGGQYSQINSIPDSNTSYLDSTVQGGRTYYYVTTAIAANGKQSAYSNQVEVVIP